MLIRFLSLIAVTILATGCGMEYKNYVMDKPRVGIEKGSGNAGYLAGTPKYEEPTKKTRRVYVFEFTKPVPESEVKKVEEETASIPKVDTSIPPAPAAPAVQVEKKSSGIVIPKIDDEAQEAAVAAPEKGLTGPKEATTYTVQKDDTLQKISKKVYGSYAGWMKIYKANKEKMKNPNYVKPGTVLTIPAVK